MPEAMGKIFACVLACMLMFMYPVLTITQQQDMMTQTYVMNKTSRFVDAIRNGGYLNEEMLTVFNNQLACTGNAYAIKITHEHKSYLPVYDEHGNFTDKAQIIYKNTYEDEILEELYNGSGEYDFSQGDYISVVISTRTQTLSQKLGNMLSGLPSDSVAIRVSYGGRIRDELH